MNPDDFSNLDGVPPLLLATLHMDEAVEVFRMGSSLRSFPGPSAADPNWEAWHVAERECRDRCEVAIRSWVSSKIFPILDDHEAYFLRRRFDHVSMFLQRLFLQDQSSPFSHVCDALDELVWWALVDWWDAWGAWEVFLADLALEDEGGGGGACAAFYDRALGGPPPPFGGGAEN